MTRRPRDQRRRPERRSLIDRYGIQALSAVVLLTVVAVGGYLYLQSTRPAYACTTLLTQPAPTPTPIVTPTPRPTIPPTPTPRPTATPSPTAAPSPTPTASPTATASPSQSPTANPSESPTASATASASPTATPTPSPIPTATPEPTPTPVPTPHLGFVVTDRGRTHLDTGDTVQYAECPPTSGPHWGNPAKRGYYRPDQQLPAPAWLHSLEHGMIVVLYSCGPDGNACPDQATLDALRRFEDDAPQTAAAAACGIANKLIVARFDQMTTRFAAVGWDRAMLSDTFDPATFLTFYSQWVDNAPTAEALECDGTTGAD